MDFFLHSVQLGGLAVVKKVLFVTGWSNNLFKSLK